MSNYKNFKAVIYCPAEWTSKVTVEELNIQYDFYKQYLDFDKVYLETYRSGVLVNKEKILFIKKFLEDKGIEVSGGITTTTGNPRFSSQEILKGKEYKSQRLFDTFCYSDVDFCNELKRIVEFTASIFDEIIFDDFYFTNCACEDCIKAKGNKTWKQYRLELMKKVSKEIIVKPAKKINPNCKVIIKFPNWMESFAEAGYNPAEEKDIFDGIYTGTETRHMMDQDQTLPRYLSYSLVRWMENLAPGRNGGGWFDAYQCYPMESYLEQAYLTAFSKAKELMMFCWPLVYNHYFIPTLGFQMKKLDSLMTNTGNCIGVSEYHPVYAQGEDHLSDYLGLLGIPFEPTPNFLSNEKVIFFTRASCEDKDIFAKLEQYVKNGGHAIVTSGFIRQMLENGSGIEQMTSLRYRGRSITCSSFQYHSDDTWEEYKVMGTKPITFPLMEHRNNVSWMILKGLTDGKNCPIMVTDTYGKGVMTTFNVPDNYFDLNDLPKEILTEVRKVFCYNMPIYLECGKNIGLFIYDNDTFVTYPYEYKNEGPQPCYIHVKGKIKGLINITNGRKLCSGIQEENKMKNSEETIFKIDTHPDIFEFWKIER